MPHPLHPADPGCLSVIVAAVVVIVIARRRS